MSSVKVWFVVGILSFQKEHACQWVVNKDPTLWLDGARPANTCTPPSFPWNAPMQPHCVPTKKVHLQVYKNWRFQVLNKEFDLYDFMQVCPSDWVFDNWKIPFFTFLSHSVPLVRQKINAQLMIKLEQIPFEQMMLEPGNTKGGIIIVPLTSCLTGSD